MCQSLFSPLPVTHLLLTCAGHAVFKKYTLDGRWNRLVSSWSHIYENVLKWLGLNLPRPRGGWFKTYAFCTSIWLRAPWKTSHFFPFQKRCCTAARIFLKPLRTLFEKSSMLINYGSVFMSSIDSCRYYVKTMLHGPSGLHCI